MRNNVIPVLVGAVALSAAFLDATSASGQTTPPPTPVKTPQTMTADKPVNEKVGAADSTFIRTAGRDNKAEIDVARLGEDKATNPQLKDFAGQLRMDHEQVSRELGDLADKKDVKVPDVTVTEKMAKDRLDKMKGPEFDKAFINQMVRDHELAVASYTKAAASADPDVKAFASKTLPALKDHLQKAKDLQKVVAPPAAKTGRGGGR